MGRKKVVMERFIDNTNTAQMFTMFQKYHRAICGVTGC